MNNKNLGPVQALRRDLDDLAAAYRHFAEICETDKLQPFLFEPNEINVCMLRIAMDLLYLNTVHQKAMPFALAVDIEHFASTFVGLAKGHPIKVDCFDCAKAHRYRCTADFINCALIRAGMGAK